MADVSSTQYSLGVAIGHLVVTAMTAGASHDEVIATLEHCSHLAQLNKDMGADFAKLDGKRGMVMSRPRHPATSIGE